MIVTAMMQMLMKAKMRTMNKTKLLIVLSALIFTACGKASEPTATEATVSTSAVETVETAADTDKVNDKPDASQTSGEMVTADTEFIRGVHAGMTVDEVRAALGEGDADLSGQVEDAYLLTYGKSNLIFESMPEVFGDDEQRLSMLMIKDNEIGLADGMQIGTPLEDTIAAFFHDEEDRTPDDLREKNGRIIYGLGDYEKLDRIADGKLADGETQDGDYKLGITVELDDGTSLAYMDIHLHEKYSSFILMLQYDDEMKLDNILMRMTDSNIMDEFFGQ